MKNNKININSMGLTAMSHNEQKEINGGVLAALAVLGLCALAGLAGVAVGTGLKKFKEWIY